MMTARRPDLRQKTMQPSKTPPPSSPPPSRETPPRSTEAVTAPVRGAAAQPRPREFNAVRCVHIEDLRALLESYLEPKDIVEIVAAYEFGARAHQGQSRVSGEPYITHPLEVAHML